MINQRADPANTDASVAEICVNPLFKTFADLIRLHDFKATQPPSSKHNP
jgi:hypothetical protein